jgi:hypothetical protein
VREQYNAERKRRREEEEGKTGAGAQAAKVSSPAAPCFVVLYFLN